MNGNTIGTYPSTIKLDRRFTYNLAATPILDYDFVTWQKNNANTTISPAMNNQNVTFKYVDAETIVAEFVYNPPPPPPPPPPPTPTPQPLPRCFYLLPAIAEHPHHAQQHHHRPTALTQTRGLCRCIATATRTG